MIINWIIIAVFIVLGLSFLKLEHHTRKIKIVIIAILALVLYFSLMGLLNSNESNLDSPKGIISAVYSYFGWIGETGTEVISIGKDTVLLVGNAVKINTSEENFRG